MIASSTNQDSLQAIYQELILDHNKSPRNFYCMHDADSSKEGFNPLCGDHLFLYLKFSADRKKIESISFQGEGCAVSKASSSMMTQAVLGLDLEQGLKKVDEFISLITKKISAEDPNHNLGKLKVFAGIWKYPARVKCAGLSWHTLKQALLEEMGQIPTAQSPVKTE